MALVWLATIPGNAMMGAAGRSTDLRGCREPRSRQDSNLVPWLRETLVTPRGQSHGVDGVLEHLGKAADVARVNAD